MRDGIYRLVYAGVASSALGVFVVRNGRFHGVGQAGAEYQGDFRFEPARNLYLFEGHGQFPPETEMVTGGTADRDGVTIPIKGEMSSPDPSTRFSLDFAGRAVDVAITYVAPIPG